MHFKAPKTSVLSFAGITSIVLSLLCTPIRVNALPAKGVLDIENMVIKLGSNPVNIITYKNSQKSLDLHIISLHHNESLIVPLVISQIIENGGSLTTVKPSLDVNGELCRYANLVLNGKSFFVDPNRIWDDDKIVVYPYGTCSSPDMERELSGESLPSGIKLSISKFREDLVGLLGISDSTRAGFLLAAIHNNRDQHFNRVMGNKACFDLKQSSSSLNDSSTKGDWFLVTTPKAFSFFSSRNYNVIFQKEKATTSCNDGSLSIFAQAKGIPFVTLETNYVGEACLESEKDCIDKNRNTIVAQMVSAKMLISLFQFAQMK